MSDLVRTQVLLEKKQRKQLNEIARKEGKPFSQLIREYLDSEIRRRTYAQMCAAAEQLRGDYGPGTELTEWTALDSEDFLNA
ncbi:MAG TPA: ribbon-helix-helix protein, CopG family [Anaerolineaceae bacterium]|nr:ribbon-helix-helix protein, CopG family [Anaerolineaceae bacterium]